MEKSPADEEFRRTLLVKNIPPSLAKRMPLKTHFEQFGPVVKLLINMERGAAVVEFETHEQAANARSLGTAYHNHDIGITWKRKSASRSNSLDSPKFDPKTSLGRLGSGMIRSSLFGKAISSATGRSVADARLKALGGDHSRPPAHSTPSSPPRAGPPSQRAVKREPVSKGLYDDLPPPSDWDEDSATFQADKSEVKLKLAPQLVKLSALTKQSPKKPSPSTSTSGPTLFGKASQKKAGIGLFGKYVKSEPASSGGVLFGKNANSGAPAVAGTSRDLSKLQNSSGKANGSSKRLFGKNVALKSEPSASGEARTFKPVQEISSDVQNATSRTSFVTQPTSRSTSPASSDSVPRQPVKSLFGRVEGTRSASPARVSVMGRLSPARPGPTRSASPFPGQTLPFTVRRSPSPAPVYVTPLAGIDEQDTEVEWIMPPSLAVLRQTTAMSSSERQVVLEKREKLMRQGMSKESDISKASATKGCCPDMCPERERYIREERRRVHIYEIVPGTEAHPRIDHGKAVKEYSRSSADQEEPLPLELRPSHVLAKTMEYLCNNILNIGADGMWGDYYDFLWSRTRAIRKDITQQHLCSHTAAGLVEKCVRWHIYCGARLVEEDSMTFDSKINDENLTKCLQTLKEMYADLLKRGVSCESEAEFRAYVVLMNLNEGETLREVQQLRSEVRSSPKLKFALSAYAALNDKNYVKFFKLVKGTSILNACILHRYFSQMRYEAIKIILKAYSAPKLANGITFEKLVRMLHFEDANEGANFLEHYGFSITHASSTLSKECFIEPESPVVVRRAPNLVESKLTTNLGEAVYGEPLPPNVLLQPTSSFDDRGFFVGIVKPPHIEQSGMVHVQKVEAVVNKLPLLDQIPNQVIKDTVKGMFLEVIDPMSREISVECVAEESKFVDAAKQDVENLTNQVVGEMCAAAATEALEDARKEQRVKQMAEETRQFNKVTSEYLSDLVENVQVEEAKLVALDTYREVKAKLYEQHKARCADAVGSQLIHQHMVCLLEEVVRQVYQTDVTERLQELERAERCVHTVCCRRFFRKWASVYQKRTHLRRSMITFPAAPPMLPQKRSQEFKVTKHTVSLSKRSRLSVGTPRGMDADIELSVIQRKIKLMLSNAPLNMSKVLASALGADNNGSDYMKLILLRPDSQCEEDRRLSNWLTNKLSKGSLPPDNNPDIHGDLLSFYNVSVDGDCFGSSGRKFGVCIRSCKPHSLDPAPLGMSSSLCGANMAAFLLPYTEAPHWRYWNVVKEQLESFLHTKPPKPSLPLLIISPLGVAKETVQYELGVYDLMEQGLVSDVRVDRIDNTVDYSNTLQESMQWLVSNRPSPPDLLITDVRSVLETFLTSHFLSAVYEDLADRQAKDLIHQCPEDLINFFNEKLAEIHDMVCGGELELYSWPIFEHNHRIILEPEQCHRLVQRLMLPPIQHSASDDWYQTCTDIAAYLDDLVQQCREPGEYLRTSKEAIPVLYSRVKQLLAKTESVFTWRCERTFHHPPRLEPLRYNVPWAHIVVACVEFVLYTVNPLIHMKHRPFVDEMNVTGTGANIPKGPDVKYSDTMISAMTLAQKHQENDDSLLDLELSIHAEPLSKIQVSVTDELNASRQFAMQLEAELSESANRGDVSEFGAVRQIHVIREDSDTDSLDELIKRETKESREFEEYLQSMLESAL